MFNFNKIPLAWLQLTRERTRLLVALAGIAFADILMFMQLGFQDSLYYSNVRFHNSIDADVMIISAQSTSLIAMESFSQRRLFQALDINGVASVHPIYIDFTTFRNPVTGIPRNILIYGFNPESSIFNLSGVRANLDRLKNQDTILFDSASRSEFGPIAENFRPNTLPPIRVGRNSMRVVGLFTLGASFGADGNLITSDTNFLRLFTPRPPGLIELGAIRLRPGANPERVVRELRNYLNSDVRVLTKQGYIDFERDFWAQNTAIGFIFTLGTIMGFIVGIVIVYQILYTEVADNLSEYATLKAIGYPQNYLLNIILQEAFLLAIWGYIPGILITLFLYEQTRVATLLPIFMTIERGLLVLILTILMCFISGAIAVRKLRSAQPADIFN